MRQLVKVVIVAAVLVLGGAVGRGQADDVSLGRQVVLKPGTVLLRDRPAGDDPQRKAKAAVDCRSTFHVYFVLRAEGSWLCLHAEEAAASGWAPADRVVPYDGAIDYATRAIRDNPNDAGAYLYRGNLWRAQGTYDEPIPEPDGRDLPALPGRFPRDGRARAAKAIEALDKAMADYNEAIRIAPGNAQAYDERGLAWHVKGDLDKAITDYTEAIRLAPADAEAHLSRGDARLRKDDFDDAIADFDEAIRIEPKNAEAYFRRGVSWLMKRDFDKALADLDEAIRLDPGHAEAYRSRGSLLQQDGELDQAIADYTKAIAIDPDSADSYDRRARAWQAKGNHDRAIADYTEAIRIDPDDAYAHEGRACQREAKREHDQAIADYTEAIRIDAQSVTAYYNRGNALANKKEYDRAIADYTEAIRLDPKDAWSYNNRAWLWATCSDARYRDGQRAVESATRACDLSGWKEASYLDTLAAAYAEAGDFEAAVKWQEKAQELYADETDRARGRARLELYRAKKPFRNEAEAN